MPVRHLAFLLFFLQAVCSAQTPAAQARLYEGGDKEAAYRMALELIKADSTRAYAAFALAKYHTEYHRWDSAVGYFHQAISWDTGVTWISGWAHALLGKCYLDSGFALQANEQLHMAVSLGATYNAVAFAAHLLDSLTRSAGTGVDHYPAWVIIEGVHASYHFQDTVGWRHYGPAFIAIHERAYEHDDSVFQATLPHKAVMYVWKDPLQAQRLLGMPLGFADPRTATCNVHMFQTPGHELTHLLSHWAWGKEPVVTTRFINEGVAVAFDCNTKDKYDVARRAIKGRPPGTVLDIWANDKSLGEGLVYPVGGAFMTYVYLNSRPGVFRALVKQQTIAGARAIYGTAQFDNMILEFDRLIGFR